MQNLFTYTLNSTRKYSHESKKKPTRTQHRIWNEYLIFVFVIKWFSLKSFPRLELEKNYRICWEYTGKLYIHF